MSFGLVHHWFLLKYLIKTFWIPLHSSRGCDTYFWITVYKEKRELALLTNNKPYRFIWEMWASSSNSSERKYAIESEKKIRGRSQWTLHRKSKQIFPEMNLRVSFLISAFIWAVYKWPRSVHLFCCIAFADWSCEYITHSQIHEFRNWERGRVSIHFSNNEIQIFFVYLFCKIEK
jgi:hypothetical protein